MPNGSILIILWPIAMIVVGVFLYFKNRQTTNVVDNNPKHPIWYRKPSTLSRAVHTLKRLGPANDNQNGGQPTEIITDEKSNTIWPNISAIMAIVAGVVLAIVAYIQINFPDDLTRAIGYINALVTLAYLWVAVGLAQRKESAYHYGLTLSLGNVGFVMLQLWFWGTFSTISDFQGFIGLGFIATDLLLFGASYMSFGDLVPPLLPKNVPNSPNLNYQLKHARNLSQSDLTSFEDIRASFIAKMHRKFRGRVEIGEAKNAAYIDLVIKPLFSELGFLFAGGSSQHKRYTFHLILTQDQVKREKGSSDYIVAYEASQEALEEATKGLIKPIVYVLKNRLTTGSSSISVWRQPSDFQIFAKDNLGTLFQRPASKRKLA